MNSKRSIKHYFILPSYQLKLVIFIATVVLIGSIFHIVFLNYITTKNLTEHFNQNQIEQIWEILRPAIIVTNIFSFVFLTIFIVVVTILVTHKLIGPMLKVTGYINKINSGILPKDELRLRENDEGQPLCEAINKTNNLLKRKFLKLESIKDSINNKDVVSQLDKTLEGVKIE